MARQIVLFCCCCCFFVVVVCIQNALLIAPEWPPQLVFFPGQSRKAVYYSKTNSLYFTVFLPEGRGFFSQYLPLNVYLTYRFLSSSVINSPAGKHNIALVQAKLLPWTNIFIRFDSSECELLVLTGYWKLDILLCTHTHTE